MNNEQLNGHDKTSMVELHSGDYWVRLALSLANGFVEGELVRFGQNAKATIEAMDALSSSYRDVNWMSAVASGALYAFRTLRIPRQHVVVTELSGRLRASDMEAIANCSAMAIAKLVDKELPGLPSEGWTMHAPAKPQLSPI